MKAIVIAYVVVASAVILLCFLSPYGSRIFGLIHWWSVVGTLGAAAICLMFWAAGTLKRWLLNRILPVQVAFILSVPVSSIVGSRNDLFLAEVSGIVTQRYVGGHALKSLEIESPNGDFYHIEGLPEVTWNAVSSRDAFIKSQGFHITVGRQEIELNRDGKLWKCKEPMQNKQADGCDGDKLSN